MLKQLGKDVLQAFGAMHRTHLGGLEKFMQAVEQSDVENFQNWKFICEAVRNWPTNEWFQDQHLSRSQVCVQIGRMAKENQLDFFLTWLPRGMFRSVLAEVGLHEWPGLIDRLPTLFIAESYEDRMSSKRESELTPFVLHPEIASALVLQADNALQTIQEIQHQIERERTNHERTFRLFSKALGLSAAEIPSKQLSAPIEVLDFSSRTYNGLRKSGINTLQDLLCRTAKDLCEIRAFGVKSLREVEEKLRLLNLELCPTTQ